MKNAESLPKYTNPDQAWFWSERWQRMEQEAQADIDAGFFAPNR